MKSNKTLNTIQPVSNLQNYSKNIAPVLRSGKSVNLTRDGKNYWVVMTNRQASNLENKGISNLLGALLQKKLNHISNKKSLTPDEFMKKLKLND